MEPARPQDEAKAESTYCTVEEAAALMNGRCRWHNAVLHSSHWFTRLYVIMTVYILVV